MTVEAVGARVKVESEAGIEAEAGATGSVTPFTTHARYVESVPPHEWPYNDDPLIIVITPEDEARANATRIVFWIFSLVASAVFFYAACCYCRPHVIRRRVIRHS